MEISVPSTGDSVQNTEQSVLSAECQVSCTELSVTGAKCEALEPATRDVFCPESSRVTERWLVQAAYLIVRGFPRIRKDHRYRFYSFSCAVPSTPLRHPPPDRIVIRVHPPLRHLAVLDQRPEHRRRLPPVLRLQLPVRRIDRKSTRLNSS